MSRCQSIRLGDGPNSMYGTGRYQYQERGQISYEVDLGTLIAKSPQLTLRRADGQIVAVDPQGDTCYTYGGLDSELDAIPLNVHCFAQRENGRLAVFRAGTPISAFKDVCTLNPEMVSGDMDVVYADGVKASFHSEQGRIIGLDPLTLQRFDGVVLRYPEPARTYWVNCEKTSTAADLRVGMTCLVVERDGAMNKIWGTW